MAGKVSATWDKRRTVGWAIIGLGSVVFVQHLVSHMGFFVVFSGGTDDLLIGYPTAGLMVVAGAFMVGGAEKGLRR